MLLLLFHHCRHGEVGHLHNAADTNIFRQPSVDAEILE